MSLQDRPPLEVLPGLYRIRLPQPALGGVYVHLAKGGAGPITLFDAGLPHPLTQSALGEQLAALGMTLGDIEQVVYTHSHIDHMGGGYALSAQNTHASHVAFYGCVGACEDFPAFMASAISWDSLQRQIDFVPELRQALSADRMGLGQYASFDKGRPIRFARGVREGDVIAAGPYHWRVHETPGHNPHHVVFHCEEIAVLIGGDLILDHGTPIMRSMGDDVFQYLESLRSVEKIGLKTVLTSHGRYYSDGAAALARTRAERERLLLWAWHRIAKSPQRIFDLAVAAAQTGELNARQLAPLLMGIFESALHAWELAGAASMDPATGVYSVHGAHAPRLPEVPEDTFRSEILRR